MPKNIKKSLQKYLSKLKNPKKQIQFPLRGCKHVRTPSFHAGGKAAEQNDGVSLSDVDRFLFENFKSLYLEECEEGNRRRTTPRLLDPPLPEYPWRSPRFFVESGSSSSRIMEEPFSSSTADSSTESETAPEAESSLAPEDFIALLKYSPRPYDEFRRSMQEMVEMRLEHNGKVDWGFLEELLFCYLDLNDKKSHRYVLRAFVDVVGVLRGRSGESPANPRSFEDGDRIIPNRFAHA